LLLVGLALNYTMQGAVAGHWLQISAIGFNDVCRKLLFTCNV